MGFRATKGAMTFIIVVAVIFGAALVAGENAFASSSGTVVVVRPGFDDRFVVQRPFFNPFFFDREDFFEEEDFFFDREEFFEEEFEEEFFEDFFDRERRPFFRRFERDDDD